MMRREYVPPCFLSCCYTFYLAMLHHIFIFPLNTEVRWHSSRLHQRKWKITMYRTMLYINVAINILYHRWFFYLVSFNSYLISVYLILSNFAYFDCVPILVDLLQQFKHSFEINEIEFR